MVTLNRVLNAAICLLAVTAFLVSYQLYQSRELLVNYGEGEGFVEIEVTNDSFELHHFYAEDGVYTVSLIGCTFDGCSMDSIVIPVKNVPPLVAASQRRVAFVGEVVGLAPCV